MKLKTYIKVIERIKLAVLYIVLFTALFLTTGNCCEPRKTFNVLDLTEHIDRRCDEKNDVQSKDQCTQY